MEILLRAQNPHSPLQLAPEMFRFPPIRVQPVEEGKTEECVQSALAMERSSAQMEVGDIAEDLIELAYADMRMAYR